MIVIKQVWNHEIKIKNQVNSNQEKLKC